MDPATTAIAGLLKEYGMGGLCALLIFALITVTKWWRESMNARLEDKDKITERMATALERQASTNSAMTDQMGDMRDGQNSILRTTTEAALTSAAADKAILEKIEESRKAIDRNAGARSA